MKHWEMPGAQCTCSSHTLLHLGELQCSLSHGTASQSREQQETRRGTATGSRQISDLSPSKKNHQGGGSGHLPLSSEDVPSPYSLQDISIFSFLLQSLGSHLSRAPQDNGGPSNQLLIHTYINYFSASFMSLLKLGNLFFLLASWGITTNM